MSKSEAPSRKKKPSDSPKKNPWDPIFASANHFLTELECTREMFALVAPILETNDAERQKRMGEIGEEFEDEEKGKTGRQFTSLKDLREFIKQNSRMKRGDILFRRNIVVGLVSQLDNFLMDVLRVAFTQNSNWLKNAEKKLSYKEVLESASMDTLKQDLIIREIEQLMRDSHHAQLSFLDSKLKLGIEDGFSGWHCFIEITERRNLFVHNGGCVNQTYISNAERYEFPLNPKYRDGLSLTVSDNYIGDTIDCLHELTVRIAQGSARRIFPDCFHEADQTLNSQTVDLLSDERWDLAEKIFRYALGIPSQLRSEDGYKYYALLNLCIALKFSGKEFEEQLNSVDWGPMHPKYHFAIAVLRDQFDEASELMKSQAVLKEVPKENFLEWPLLREFRESTQFEKAFNELFSEDETENLLKEARETIDTEQGEPEQITSSPASKPIK